MFRVWGSSGGTKPPLFRRRPAELEIGDLAVPTSGKNGREASEGGASQGFLASR